MVIDGSTIKESHVWRAKVEGERIRLPDSVVERSKHDLFKGKSEFSAWLLVITPGRYRLVLDETEEVSKILERIGENEAPGGVLDRTSDSEKESAGARLIPCVISPPRPGWRVNFPQVARDLVSEKAERSFVFFLIVAGYIEIWFPDTLRRAAPASFSKLLSD